jgi:cation diffusion facilitator family transporter
MDLHCPDCAKFLEDDHVIESNRKKTRWVLALTTLAMIGEIIAGHFTGSMALVADGWHMASHAGALLIALFAYQIARSQKLSKKFSFGAGKVIPLGGFTSAVILSIVAILIFSESFERLFNPNAIQYNEAIGVACIGFVVNLMSALILNHEHGHEHAHEENHDHGHDDHRHDHHHVHDHNLRAAFLHIAMDAITSLFAVGGLLLAKYQGWNWMDPVVGLLGAIVIGVWAFRLCRDTGWELLDGHSKTVNWKKLKNTIEISGTRILDFHVWRIAPTAVACELVVEASEPLGLEHYRRILKDDFLVQHVIVEERHRIDR